MRVWFGLHFIVQAARRCSVPAAAAARCPPPPPAGRGAPRCSGEKGPRRGAGREAPQPASPRSWGKMRRGRGRGRGRARYVSRSGPREARGSRAQTPEWKRRRPRRRPGARSPPLSAQPTRVPGARLPPSSPPSSAARTGVERGEAHSRARPRPQARARSGRRAGGGGGGLAAPAARGASGPLRKRPAPLGLGTSIPQGEIRRIVTGAELLSTCALEPDAAVARPVVSPHPPHRAAGNTHAVVSHTVRPVLYGCSSSSPTVKSTCLF